MLHIPRAMNRDMDLDLEKNILTRPMMKDLAEFLYSDYLWENSVRPVIVRLHCMSVHMQVVVHLFQLSNKFWRNTISMGLKPEAGLTLKTVL